MRRVVEFPCKGTVLLGTVDEAADTAGLLIVSGGNEIGIGAHRGMSKLAKDIAATGHPVFRFDRRGIGDSEGANGGFESSRDDILAALTAFRTACPALKRIIAFGNCDAATALWLHQPLEIDALVLANPWLVEATTEAPAPATARAYYARRLRDPRAWADLLKGAVNFGRLFQSLRTAAQRDEPSSLAARVVEKLASFPVPTEILLATRDGTAVAFKAQWDGPLFARYRPDIPVRLLDSGSHSFASDADYSALKVALSKALSA